MHCPNAPSIAFFVGAAENGRQPANDNHTRLPRGFAAAGWTVALIDRDSLAVENSRLVAETLSGSRCSLTGFDLYFPLGFGGAASFLDRMQLLRSLHQRRFVNTVDALVYQHGKASLILACPEVAQPLSHLGNDAHQLAEVVAAGGTWIAKPSASSFGRDVFRLQRRDTNLHAILENLTRDGRYALLQECVAGTEEREKRVLIAAGVVVGAYRKRPADHRGNLDAGATAATTRLSAEESAVAERLAAKLEGLGVRFAGVDLVDGVVLEINVANPGWLATYEAATGADLTPKVVDALQHWWHSGSESVRLQPSCCSSVEVEPIRCPHSRRG